MDIYTVSFFGHRVIHDFSTAERQAKLLIQILLLEKEYIDFMVGRDGAFDQIISPIVRRLKRLVRDDNSSLTWGLPYLTANLRDNQKNFEEYYDAIEVCDIAARNHPKSAFQVRNRWIVDHSDMVVFYVDHKGGGAYQTLCYAQKKNKFYINLASHVAL